ncbi:MAG: hypothetical protein AMQ22_00794 [Candidatus Methanofastidiosum methylothiophilum]|uniref:LamG-like jellyroll fold domain-containing protein n=1 Tax=Candidatus Methanofastidiosum methylothiophilum TaxID=1705564 RepID=A0A150J5U5_9EURY|nr:MAG: hypothetical protein AMQ22_00794 [Candidatus Methanofastidiosum methylthiophilus]
MKSTLNILFVLFISITILMPLGSLNITSVYADNWWNDEWAYREQITIANAGTTILINYPAYIQVPYKTGMQTDYDDLRFTTADGALVLDYEIEYFDSTNAHIWVRIPSLTVPNVSIWMYYGNDAATSGQNPTGVWDSNHIGVWHMSENSGTIYDSTINNIDGTPFNGVNQNINGAIDGADSFNRNNSQYINLGRNNLHLSSLTVSAWVYMTAAGGTDKQIVSKGHRGSNTEWELKAIPQENSGRDIITFRFWVNNSARGVVSTTALSAGQWHYLVGTYNASATNNNFKLYIDGVLNNSNTNLTPKTQTDANISIAAVHSQSMTPNHLQYWNGVLDEIRISDVPRSADWIKQSYSMVNDQSGYVAFGGSIPKPNPPLPQIKRELPMDQISRILGISNSKPTGEFIQNNCIEDPEAEGCKQ